MPKVEINVSADWRSFNTTSGGELSDEQTLMVLERATSYYRNRVATMMFHKTTAEMLQEENIRRMAGQNGPGSIIQP